MGCGSEFTNTAVKQTDKNKINETFTSPAGAPEVGENI